MHPSPPSGNIVTSSTIANTACYDPLSKCIRLPSLSSDGGAILEGSIIEMDTPPSYQNQLGKLLLAEIVEIVIMEEDMVTPLAVYNENTIFSASPLSPEEASSTNLDSQSSLATKITRGELLQKQREQQQLHYQESQDLLQQHQREERQLENLYREGRLSDDGKIELSAEMENTHRMELVKLHEDHHKEQVELTNLIFESASSSVAACEENSKGDTATAKHNSATSQLKDEQLLQPTNESQSEKNTAGLWNRAVVATVAADTIDHNRDTILISNKTTNENLDDRKKEELKAIISDPNSRAAPATTLPSSRSDPQSMEKLRRGEVQDVMRDRTLSKKEKQEKLAEIKAKYAKGASSSSNNAEAKKKSHVRWNQAAVSAVSANTFNQTSQSTPQPPPTREQPQVSNRARNRWGGIGSTMSTFNRSFKEMKQAQGKSTPMSEFIQKIKSNDPSLVTIMLDGRKDVSNDEWSRLFDALESNSHLTHLSLVDCGLSNETALSLILALVENETLFQMNLSNNPEITNKTGKMLVKVLNQSNTVLKYVFIGGTNISTKVSENIADILADRDENLKLAKIQAERQKKISELLSFSASDKMSSSSKRLSARLLQIDKDNEYEAENATRSVKSASTKSTGGNSKKDKRKKKRLSASSEESKSTSSRGSSKPSSRSKASQRAASIMSGSVARAGVGDAPNAKLKRSMKASVAARNMAMLGGDIASGAVRKTVDEVRGGRKLRGECEDCGEKCFKMTLFKSIPLTVPGRVDQGRCLVCNAA